MELDSFVFLFFAYVLVTVVGAVPTALQVRGLERRAVLKDLSAGFCRSVWLACEYLEASTELDFRDNNTNIIAANLAGNVLRITDVDGGIINGDGDANSKVTSSLESKTLTRPSKRQLSDGS